MKRLLSRHQGRGKLPHPLRSPLHLPLHNQIQRPIHQPIQPSHIPLLIRLGPPLHRRLHGHPLLRHDRLTVLTDAHLSVRQQPLHHDLRIRRRAADEHLVVPGHAAARVVAANVLGGHAVALAQLDAEVEVRRRVLLVVEGPAEGGRQPLIETLLVEVVGRLKGRLLAREQRGAGEDDAGFDAVAGGVRGGGWLGGCCYGGRGGL